jgi:hypothetical protein
MNVPNAALDARETAEYARLARESLQLAAAQTTADKKK